MSRDGPSKEIESRVKTHLVNISNYENAVTLICSLEGWFRYRWGPKGKNGAGLLKTFDRFPEVEGLRPDFEIQFYTPYVIWGDHKRTIPAASTGRSGAIEQILKYAARSNALADVRSKNTPDADAKVNAAYDVVVIVNQENDDVAAEAINSARLHRVETMDGTTAKLAPIVVLGCHRDRESINGEWFKIKWRSHHQNSRFRNPNVSTDRTVEDLNALICGKTHLAIPVDRSAMDLSSRSPFINDSPPAIYTAVRLVIPVINSLLSEDERDELQSFGAVDKTVTKGDILGSELVTSMTPLPPRIGTWVEDALEFMAVEAECARKTGAADNQQFVVTINGALIKGDPKDLFSGKAALLAAKKARMGARQKKPRRDDPRQFKMKF